MGSTDTTDATPFWNLNIPEALHTEHCPAYLEYALDNEKDRRILSTLDADYHRQTWPEVRGFIQDNRIDRFQRVPSDLRRYREYCSKLTDKFGSVMDFVMQERLGWTSLEPKSKTPFEDRDDYKILLNDWPYGIDKRIVHIVVWTKFDLINDPDTGDLTAEARKEIDDYVNKAFVDTCGKDNVIWFKNWASLKSIHTVEHFHVMLFDPPKGFVADITNGDRALADKVGYGATVKEMKSLNELKKS